MGRPACAPAFGAEVSSSSGRGGGFRVEGPRPRESRSAWGTEVLVSPAPADRFGAEVGSPAGRAGGLPADGERPSEPRSGFDAEEPVPPVQ